MLFAAVPLQEVIPIMVGLSIVAAIWSVLSLVSERNSRMQDRLARPSRPASLAEIEDPRLARKTSDRLQALTDLAAAISEPMMPTSDLEQAALNIRADDGG